MTIMIQNKLGITDIEYLNKIEFEIIKNKIDLLDYRYTFNESEYSVEFLIKLHKYLFDDIYFLENNDLQDYVDEEYYQKANKLIKDLIDKGINKQFDRQTSDVFYELYAMQLFKDGNARTLIAFFKIYLQAFNINFKFDFFDLYMSQTENYDIKKNKQMYKV